MIVAAYRITGLSPTVIAELVAEAGALWHELHQARLTARPRQRAAGAGAKHKFVFIDRLLATLVSLRHGTTHDVLACWFGVDRSTITRAIVEVRFPAGATGLHRRRGLPATHSRRGRRILGRRRDRRHRRHGGSRETPGRGRCLSNGSTHRAGNCRAACSTRTHAVRISTGTIALKVRAGSSSRRSAPMSPPMSEARPSRINRRNWPLSSLR